MTQQEHGRDAFLALLRAASADTEAPLSAWRGRIGKLVRTAIPAVCLAACVPSVPDLHA